MANENAVYSSFFLNITMWSKPYNIGKLGKLCFYRRGKLAHFRIKKKKQNVPSRVDSSEKRLHHSKFRNLFYIISISDYSNES